MTVASKMLIGSPKGHLESGTYTKGHSSSFPNKCNT